MLLFDTDTTHQKWYWKVVKCDPQKWSNQGIKEVLLNCKQLLKNLFHNLSHLFSRMKCKFALEDQINNKKLFQKKSFLFFFERETEDDENDEKSTLYLFETSEWFERFENFLFFKKNHVCFWTFTHAFSALINFRGSWKNISKLWQYFLAFMHDFGIINSNFSCSWEYISLLW